MASMCFLKLAFNCISWIWNLVALVYPLFAMSLPIIKTGSYQEIKHWLIYWMLLLSLIYLFEHAFMNSLLWFHLQQFIKLIIVLWLIIRPMRRPDAKITNEITETTESLENENINDLENIEKQINSANKQVRLPTIKRARRKQSQWICTLCSVTVSSKKTLSFHLNGRKHRSACETVLNRRKKKDDQQKCLPKDFRRVNSKIMCQICYVELPSQDHVASHQKGMKHMFNMKRN